MEYFEKCVLKIENVTSYPFYIHNALKKSWSTVMTEISLGMWPELMALVIRLPLFSIWSYPQCEWCQ